MFGGAIIFIISVEIICGGLRLLSDRPYSYVGPIVLYTLAAEQRMGKTVSSISK